MSGYNNNEAYGTTGTTGGLGSNPTGTNPYGTSNTASGLDSDVRRDDNYNSSTAGPHKSDMMNKLDPRVDSDNSKAYDNNSSRSTGTSTGGYGTSGNNSLGATGQSGLGGSSTDYGSSTTSSEPVHKSNMMNKIDPRVDSDNSKAYGNTSSGLASNTNSSTGFGSSSGPHQTGTANALDPNVNASYGNTSSSGLGSSTAYDSTNSGASTTGAGFGGNSALPDSHGSSDIRGNTATTSGGLGSSSAYGSTNSGHHSSNLANKADPMIDSDNDRLRGPDSYGSSDIRGNTATTSGGLGSSSAYGSTNSGPHSSNVANKADPRVDSDNDRLRGPDSARDHYGSTGTGSTTGVGGAGLGSSTGTYGSGTTSGPG